MNKLTQHWSPILRYFKMTDFFYLMLDVDKTKEDAIITPSQYNIEMSRNTEERLEKLKSLSRKVKMRAEPSVNTLKVTPDIVIFQKYKVGDFLSVPVAILNVYDVSKPVRVMMESTTTFTLSYTSDTVCSKIAPGMSYHFNVNFNVREIKEYCHSLIVETDCEKVEVLIVCIHPRPILDIPDTITLPTTPVKTVAERVLLIRNVGEVPAIFNLATRPPFSVHPERGILGPGKNLQLSLTFTTETLGEHSGHLQITYETTEFLTVHLKACASEANIILEYTNIEIPDTFMGLKRRKFIKLFNNSSHLVYFKWKRYESFEGALKEYQIYKDGFESVKDLETMKWFGRVYQGIIDSKQTHEMIYDRIYQDEVREFEKAEYFLYHNPNWAIHPLMGEIWPESSAMFILEFSPSQAKPYESTLYLEVAGKSERISLKVAGRGLGPSIELNLIELDANDIFLCAEHQYEVAVHNKGHIPGHISYNPKPLSFGGVVSFNPSSLLIEAGCYAAFVMKFSSKIQGKFVEDIEFLIKESGEILKFIFKGNIICPLLNFDVSDIDFGEVTLGYPISRTIKLINTTQVPIEYKVSIAQDGNNPAITCEDYAVEYIKPYIYLPKEFNFVPEEAEVSPNSSLDGTITLLPNIEGFHTKRLYLIMWGTSKYSLTLPIKYKCMTPEIECKTKDIFMRGCFINYVYTRTLVLTNLNEHAGYFMFVPQDTENNQHIKFSPQIPEDYIDAYETKEAHLDISTSYVGQSTAHVYISVFGGKEKMFICTIRCNGQGPVITIPESVNFDEIKTLREVTQTLEVINDSPVPATVTISQNKKSVFKISEAKLQLDPTEKKDLDIKVYLREPGKYSDKLVFTAVNGENQICSLYVRGVGSSILSEPELEQEVNLGFILTHKEFFLPVKFTNMGKRCHKIIWSRLKKLKSFKENSSIFIPSVFSLTPCCFDLAPGQSIQCILAGSSNTPGMVEEDFYCHALIEKNKEPGIVNSFIITAYFVKPILQLSKPEMKFRIDTTTDRSIAFLQDTLTVTNLSKLEISILINIDPPFYIKQDDERFSNIILTLADGGSELFIIEFVPRNDEKKCTISTGKITFTYADHPHKDTISLIGEENYPNLVFEPKDLDFGCIPNFYTATQTIVLRNISPLPVSFQWEWIRNDFNLTKLEYTPINFVKRVVEDDDDINVPLAPNIMHPVLIQQYSLEKLPMRRKYEFEMPQLPLYEATPTEPVQTWKAVESKAERIASHFKKMQVYLYQLVHCYDYKEKHLSPLKLLPRILDNQEYLRQVLDLIPNYGYLGPFESQVVLFEFSPCPNSIVEAVAHCHLRGGVTEVIAVRGKSSNISFSIESNVIDFGRQLFCEVCEKKVLIKNTGHTDLDVQANIKPRSEDKRQSIPNVGNYSIKTVTEGKDVTMIIRYFPGVCEEFTKDFMLQVGYLEPYTMTIHGYATPAQAYCALLRPSLHDENVIILSYKAIGKITNDILKIVRLLTLIPVHYKEDIPYSTRQMMQEEGWEIISYNQNYPTDIDIQMAIEREAIDELLKTEPEHLLAHMAGKCSNAIPNKPTFPYLIDFKYVVRDTLAHYTTTILNYGPVRNDIKLIPVSKRLVAYGVSAYISKTKLDVGESTDLVVIFNPSSTVFTTVDTKIEDVIYLTVYHGQKIPIVIRAFVTLPYISARQDSVNFDNVVLGTCVRKSVTLENKGYVQSNWSAKIELLYDIKLKGSKQLFFIKVTSGVLQCSETDSLHIYFEPSIAGKFRASLILCDQDNEEQVIVKLRGNGCKSVLKIDSPKVEFNSTLPYSQNVTSTFTIENPGMFPVEFYFADFDEIIHVEDRIVNMFLDYYKTSYLYLPERKPGQTLPKLMYDFYQTVIDKVGQKIWEEEIDKVKKEESTASDIPSNIENISELSSKMNDKIVKSTSKTTKDKKSSSTASKLKAKSKSATAEYSKLSDNKVSGTMPSLNKKEQKMLLAPSRFSMPDLLLRRTSEEIHSYIKEELLYCKSTTSVSLSDPVKKALDMVQPKRASKDAGGIKQGILLVFQGFSYTSHYQAACMAGRILNIPVLTVDEIYFDAITSKSSLASIKVNELISEAFGVIASSTDLIEPPDTDDHDRLQKKIDLLLTGKTKRTPKSAETKKEKKVKGSKSDKSNKTSKDTTTKGSGKVDKRPTFIGLPENLLYEILENKLQEYNNGLLISGLNSLFVKEPLQVLNWILLSVKNMRYIHFVLFSYTYDDYAKRVENVKEEAEMKGVSDKKAQIQTIVDMDAEEFEMITPEERELFKNEVLIPRNINSARKQEEIKFRIMMRQEGVTLDKNKLNMASKSTHDDKKLKKDGSEKDAKKGKKDAKAKDKKSKESTKKSNESSKKSSKASKRGKKSKGSLPKANPAEIEKKKVFDAADNLAGDIFHILEYWNRKTLSLTKDLSMKRATKKSKSKGGSVSSKKSARAEMPTTLIKEFSDDDKKEALFLGVPCWVLNNAYPGRGAAIMLQVINYIANNKDLSFAKKELENSSCQTVEPRTETFSCVTRPFVKKRVANISENFTLNSVIFTTQATQQVDSTSHEKETPKLQSGSKSSIKKPGSRKGRHSTESILSADKRSIKSTTTLPSSDTLSVQQMETKELEKRTVLNPGEKNTYKVTFTPNKCGSYEHTYTIELVGWPTKYSLYCHGTCDIPKLTIDLCVMFQNCCETRLKMRTQYNSYIIDEKLFEFGPILISSFANYTRALEHYADMTLQNNSSLPCNVQLVFLDTNFPPPTDIFQLSKQQLYIESNQMDTVTISAQPSAVGNVTSQLAIIVSNNPKVELVSFNCLGVDFQFYIEPSEIIFERTLLNKMVTKWLTFYNESMVPVVWRILEPEKVLQYFRLSCLKGSMGPCSRTKVEVSFVTAVLEDIPKVDLNIQILYKKNKVAITLQATTIELSAEVLNVDVDCPREVNFGEVKARMQHDKEITILSKIKYNMDFVFSPVDKYPNIKQDEQFRSLFKANPDKLTLACEKPSTVTITFYSKKCVDFTDIPIFKCVVIDPPSQNVMMTFTITASAKTFLSSFQLCPPSEIYFGHQLVGSEKMEQLTLTNTGKFDFTFSIMSLKQIIAQKAKKSALKVSLSKVKGKKAGKNKKGSKKEKSTTTKSSKSKSKTTKSSSQKSLNKKGKKDKKGKQKKEAKKPKQIKLDAGCFSIMFSTNQLQPHESTIITIISKPRTIGLVEEIIVFFISECSVQQRKGVPVVLSVKGDTPSVDFTYIQDIFCEQYIVDSILEFNCPDQAGNHCYYVKNEQALYFSKTCINNTTTTKLRFQSTCAIFTELFAEILNGKAFSVTPSKTQLDAFEHIYLDVSFTPESITSYSETLEVKYHTSIGEPVRCNVELKGEGYIPELKIIEPMVDEVSNTCWLIFNPIFVGKTQTKRMVLENIGNIECKVMIELSDENQMLFFKLLQEENIQCVTEHSVVMLIPANSKSEIQIEFKPTKDIRLDASISVFVVNNPFEFFSIQVIAESFIEDITLEDIPALSSDEYKSDLNDTIAVYNLDFGCCPLNILQKKLFKIKNNSILNIYRFEFPSLEKVVFIPAIGHLKPGSCKNIIVTVLTREPLMVQAEPLELVLSQIQYLEPEIEQLSWDERQNVITWINDSGPAIDPSSSGRLSIPSVDGVSRKSSKGKIKSANPSLKGRTKPSSKETIPENDVASDSSKLKRKKIDDKSEPAHEILADSKKIIQLLFCVNADYCTYSLNITKINLDDTFMFEKRSASFTIKNTSIVPVEIDWFIELDDNSPRRRKENSSVDLISRAVQSADVKKSEYSTRCPCTSGVKYHLIGYEQFMHEQGKSSRPPTSYTSSDSLYTKKSKQPQIDDLPFTIEPKTFEILPNTTKTFTITFSPIDACDHLIHLKSCIPNVHSKAHVLHIPVYAKSLLPLYHFDIMPNNYLINERYGKKMCGDLADEYTKVVEIEGIGLGINHVKTFHIINPTGESFDYKWVPSSTNTDDIHLFNCLIPNGHVTKGKIAKCSFSFFPQQIGTFEGFYRFVIEKYNLGTTFLLVGRAKNPCVFFSVPYLKLQPTLLRMVTSNTVILKNNDDLVLHFKIIKKSCYNGFRTDKIVVEPMEGNLEPKSEICMKIHCTPVTTGEIHFNLQCEVERMHKPLLLTVDTSAFKVEPAAYQLITSGKVILDHNIDNITQLKTLVVNQDDISTFLVKNNGKIGFYYKWSKADKSIEDFIKITFKDVEGYCKAAEERNIVVMLKPTRHLFEKDVKLKLSILYGPVYRINFICTTMKAKYKFSFTEYDFGACLVQKEKTSLYKCFLQFSHNDTKPLLLEYKDDMLDHLTVVFKTKEISPKAVETIPIYCHPIQAGTYLTPLMFSVNCKPERVTIKATAVAVDVVLEDHDDRFVNFGAVLVGRNVSKTIKVVNRTPTTIEIVFNLYERLPYFSKPKKVLESEFERPPPRPRPKPPEIKKPKKEDKKGKKGKQKGSKSSKSTDKLKKASKGSQKSKGSVKSKESLKGQKSVKSKGSSKSKASGKSKASTKTKGSRKSGSSSKVSKAEPKSEEPLPPPVESPEERKERIIRQSLSISPKQMIKLPPGGKGGFIINYNPTERMPFFNRKIYYQVLDVIEPICIVQASCIAAEYYIDRSKISFGTVVKGCQSESKFTLYNTGDIGGKYQWSIDRNRLTSDTKVTISPMQGYVSPDTSVTFSVKYQPNSVQCYTRVKTVCKIEKYKQPLEVIVTGSCTNTPPPTATIQFSCPVRTETKQTVTIHNNTETNWKITPQLTGIYFSVPDTIFIEPYLATDCEITYSPSVMTGKTKHAAKLFFPQPNGLCSLYNLEGTSLAPAPIKKVVKEIFCKTYYTEILKIKNWSKEPQKFKVITENLKPEDTVKILYKLTGNSLVDITGSVEKDYYWGIYVLNVGVLNFRVIFKNEATKEYILYEIELSIVQGDPQSEINLTTCVRQKISYDLHLENLIKTPIIFKLSCNSPHLSFKPTVTVPPLTEETVTLTYFPLFIDEQEVILTADTEELGKYLYKIVLIAKNPIPETPIVIKCSLGQNITQKAQIFNYAQTRSDYRLKIFDSSVFSFYPDFITVDPKAKGQFEVSFQPIELGNFDATLKISSETAGEYIYPLRGICELPKPQGPVKVPITSSAFITFRNPFNVEAKFDFLTESKVFFVRAASETLSPFASTKIEVFVKLNEPIASTAKYPFTGKLIVVCVTPPMANIKWVYYLQSEG